MKEFISKNKLIIFIFVLIVILFGFIFLNRSNNKEQKSLSIQKPTPFLDQEAKKNLYPVIRVIDGDTIMVDVDGVRETVRLIGIDTPEVVDPRKPVQCFGKEASNKAKEILNGKRVFLEKDPTQGERDKYKRLLRFVFLEDGTNLNKLMIQEGYAHEYTHKSSPYKYQQEFIKAEKEARKNKRGLWADDACKNSFTTPINTQNHKGT